LIIVNVQVVVHHVVKIMFFAIHVNQESIMISWVINVLTQLCKDVLIINIMISVNKNVNFVNLNVKVVQIPIHAHLA
jgi:ACT domain-containing protein